MLRAKSEKKYESPAWMENFVLQYMSSVKSTKPVNGIFIPAQCKPSGTMTSVGNSGLQTEHVGKHGQGQVSNSGQCTAQNGVAPQPLPRKNKEGIRNPMLPVPPLQIAGDHGFAVPSNSDFCAKELLEGSCKIAPLDIQLRREIDHKEYHWRQKTEETRFDSYGNLQPVNSRQIYELEMEALKNAEKPLHPFFSGSLREIMLPVHNCVKTAMRMRMDRRCMEEYCFKAEMEYEKIIIAKLFSEERKMLQEHIKYLKTIFYLRTFPENFKMATKRILEILEHITKPLIIKIECELYKLDALGPEALFSVDAQIAMHHLATVLEELQKMVPRPRVIQRKLGPAKQSIHPDGRLSWEVHSQAENNECEAENFEMKEGAFNYTMASDDCDNPTINNEEVVGEVQSQTSGKQPAPRTKWHMPGSLLRVDRYREHEEVIDTVIGKIKKNGLIKDLKDWDEKEFRMNISALHTCGFGIYESALLLNQFDNKPELVIGNLQLAVKNM